MKIYILLLMLILNLAACVRIENAPEPSVITTEKEIVEEDPELYAFNTVRQNLGRKEILYGFDREDNIILIDKFGHKTHFFYEDGKLIKIKSGDKETSVDHKEGLLSNVVTKYETTEFIRDGWGRLTEIIMHKDKYSFTYSPEDRLTSFQKGFGESTTFKYDEKDRIKSFTKALTTTNVYYDDKGRLKLLDTSNNFVVIAYWREDLLSSLSGDAYGLKETINYSPNEIKIISASDKSLFTGEINALRLKALNLYLFCKKFKKLPVLIDATSYTISNNYLKMNLESYILTNYYCEAI